MPTFYLDPENGNDANSGTSFDNRWKTLTTGGTAVRIGSGGAEIRVMASRDPVSQGTCTFTNGSDQITLPQAKTTAIEECNALWTAVSSNITQGLRAERAMGTHSLSFTPASAFTTGKVAYKTFGTTLNLSAYQSVSFMVSTGGTLTGGWTLRLCSDALGDTVVHSIPISASSGRWRCVYFDNNSALGATINSISLHSSTDPGTVSLYIDNIVACYHKDHADHLCHNCVVGRNTISEPEWYPIFGIDGANLKLRSMSNPTGQSALSMFRGETGSHTGYTMHPTPTTVSADYVLQQGGNLHTGPITITGGWDRATMTAQTGSTWWTGQRNTATGLNINDRSGVVIERMGFAGYVTNAFAYGTTTSIGSNTLVNLLGATDIGSSVIASGTAGTGSTKLSLEFTNMSGGRVLNRDLMDCNNYGEYIVNRAVNTLSNSAGAFPAGYGGSSKRLKVKKIIGCEYGVDTSSFRTLRVSNCSFIDCYSPFFSVKIGNAPVVGTIYMDNCYTTDLSFFKYGGDFSNGPVYLTNHNGNPDTLIEHYSLFNRNLNSKLTRSGNGMARRLELNGSTFDQIDEATGTFPGIPNNIAAMAFKGPTVARIAVRANKLVTVKAWVRHANLNDPLVPTLFTSEWDNFPGVGTVFGRAPDTGALNAEEWGQVSLSFTPTATGMVNIYVNIFDHQSGALEMFVDDVTYTIAP